MAVRDTSKQAYAELHQSLGLSRQQTMILRLVARHRLLTRREIATKLNLDVSAVAGRVNELIKLGYLQERAARPCSITGRSAHTLDVVRELEAA